MSVSLPKDVTASLDQDEGAIRFGDEVYRWLRPDQSAAVRAAVAGLSKPPERKTATDMVRLLLQLISDYGLGTVSGPLRKVNSDIKPEGNLFRFLLVGVFDGNKRVGEDITVQFVAEETLLARLKRGDQFSPKGKSLLRLLDRYGDQCFPWLFNWAYQHDARALWEGRTSRAEDKIDALRFTDLPEAARLMAERANQPTAKDWLTSNPIPAARGLTRTFLNLARAISVLLDAGHREMILNEAGSMNPLSDDDRQLLERLLDAAGAPSTPAAKAPPRVEVGLFGNDIAELAATRFEIGERRSITKDAELTPEERKLVKGGLASLCALHDHTWKTVETFLKALHENDIEVQLLTDLTTKVAYTLVVHYAGENAAGFVLRNSDRIAVAEVQDGALSYDPTTEWP